MYEVDAGDEVTRESKVGWMQRWMGVGWWLVSQLLICWGKRGYSLLFTVWSKKG